MDIYLGQRELTWVNPVKETSSMTRGSNASVSQVGGNIRFDLSDDFNFEEVRYLAESDATTIFEGKSYVQESFLVTEKNEKTGEKEAYRVTTPVVSGSKFGIMVQCAQTTTFWEFGKVSPQANVRKPVIYFRFQKDVRLSVNIKYSGQFDIVYPKADILGPSHILWNCKIKNNKVQVGDKNYPYLFWDGPTKATNQLTFDQGNCIARNNIIDFLEKSAKLFGLDEDIITDFVTFWAPYLSTKAFVKIKFLSDSECDFLAKMKIEADVKFEITRMYIMFECVDNFEDMEIQEILPKTIIENRVIEWGGFEQI